MKLYVIPVETACNANCKFCITKYRKNANKQILNIDDLKKVLDLVTVDSIEITGGGEPCLHPNISKIISMCSKHSKTKMYTNAGIEMPNVEGLTELCISRSHHKQNINKKIMGISYDDKIFEKIDLHIKFSLLLHKSGISTLNQVKEYCAWAKKYAKKIVIRQIFEHDYNNELEGEHISTELLFKKWNPQKVKYTSIGNPIFYYADLLVEIETRSCSCELNNPVLHADGKLYQGWSMNLL